MSFDIGHPFFLKKLIVCKMAERVGVEPTEPAKVHRISSAAHSATLAPLLTSS